MGLNLKYKKKLGFFLKTTGTLKFKMLALTCWFFSRAIIIGKVEITEYVKEEKLALN